MRFAILFVVAHICLCSAVHAAYVEFTNSETEQRVAVTVDAPRLKPDGLLEDVLTVHVLQEGVTEVLRASSGSHPLYVGKELVYFDADTASRISWIARADQLHPVQPDGYRYMIESQALSRLFTGNLLLHGTPYTDPLIYNVTGDFNGDGIFDASDAGMAFNNWGTDSRESDINGDRITDAFDAGVLFSKWTGDITQVPEPSTVLPLLVAAMAFRLRRSRARLVRSSNRNLLPRRPSV